MRLLAPNTAETVMVFLTLASDHVTGATGLTLTITASKAGAAFASISPTVTERGNGWYAVALTASHTDTPGDLALHVTATGADPADVILRVDALVSSRLSTSGYTAPPSAAQNAAALLDADLDAHQTVNSAGEALKAARAQGKGKWAISGDVLTIYDTDGTTALYTFDLAPTGGPYISRTPQ